MEGCGVSGGDQHVQYFGVLLEEGGVSGVSAWDSLGPRVSAFSGVSRRGRDLSAQPGRKERSAGGSLRKRWEELELRVERCHGPLTPDLSPVKHDIRPITTELRRGPANNLPTTYQQPTNKLLGTP